MTIRKIIKAVIPTIAMPKKTEVRTILPLKIEPVIEVARIMEGSVPNVVTSK